MENRDDIPGSDGSAALQIEDCAGSFSLSGWRDIASVTAGSLLGVPYISTGTLRGVWAEISQWITSSEK